MSLVARYDCEMSFEQKSNLTREELRAEYERCDLVLFASTYEGFGLPIIEAQATVRPVITSRAHSMPEVAGAGACLVDTWDVLSIRAWIQGLIADAAHRDERIVAGKANIRRFSASALVLRYAAAYRELATATVLFACATGS